MKKIILILFLSLLSSCSKIPETPLSLEDILDLEYAPIDSLSGIDPVIYDYLLLNIDEELIAEKGDAFRSTDLIMDDSPSRRFVLAGTAGGEVKFSVVCYEHGGIGYHYHVALFKSENHQLEKIKAGQWLAKDFNNLTQLNLSHLLDALENGEVMFDNHW